MPFWGVPFSLNLRGVALGPVLAHQSSRNVPVMIAWLSKWLSPLIFVAPDHSVNFQRVTRLPLPFQPPSAMSSPHDCMSARPANSSESRVVGKGGLKPGVERWGKGTMQQNWHRSASVKKTQPAFQMHRDLNVAWNLWNVLAAE
jgi:hypothetical protein